ncbi:MAG: alanine racemase [Pseudomonadota bacterium]
MTFAPDIAEVAPASERTVLEIDLDAIAANWRDLAARAAPAECAGVVKADGYGLGLAEVAPALATAGCQTFFVATLDEAHRLRDVLPDKAIYVLDGLLPGTVNDCVFHNLRPVLSSFADVEEWTRECREAETSYPAAIHVDTGMTRLGLNRDDIQRLTATPDILSPFVPSLVMSHLACADTPEHPLNATQNAAFQAVRDAFPTSPLSLANSAATLSAPAMAYDLVRPGIALYGGLALAEPPNPMRPTVRYHGRILQTQTVAAGTSIGYGATFETQRMTRLATIATGYADGYLRTSVPADRATGPMVAFAGNLAPIVGRISMDLITVDVTDIDEQHACRGGWATLIGDQTSVDDVAEAAGTIGYEILTRISSRTHRIYHPAKADAAVMD